MFVLATTRQVFAGGISTTPATHRDPQMNLKIGKCLGAVGNGLDDLALGDRATYTNEHENNYYPAFGKNQRGFAQTAKKIVNIVAGENCEVMPAPGCRRRYWCPHSLFPAMAYEEAGLRATACCSPLAFRLSPFAFRLQQFCSSAVLQFCSSAVLQFSGSGQIPKVPGRRFSEPHPDGPVHAVVEPAVSQRPRDTWLLYAGQ